MADDQPTRATWTDPGTRQQFGFHLDEEAWLAQLRAASARAPLDRLGSYELLEQVGRGAQGVVYKARQPGTGREVVIKRLSAGVFATPVMRARFEREIEAAAALEHPNIVTVYGAEVVEGQPLLVMKWIDGVAIDRWARNGPTGRRPIPEILDVFLHVCDAVHHAHQRGIIHRDLKPSNILVDRRNEPHVLDFGLARRAAQEANDNLTEVGSFLGTPGFASPEQLRGAAGDATPAGDVYALGAVLYLVLTGELPIDPDTPPLAMLEQIERGAIRSPAQIDPKLDRDLVAIVLNALQSDSAQRYPSVDALRRDLERYRRGEPIEAAPPSAIRHLRALARRNRALAVGVGAVVLTLAVSSYVSIAYQRQASEANRRQALTERERQRAETSAALDAELKTALQLDADGRFPEAESLFRDVYTRRRALVGDDHWSVAPVAQHLGDRLLALSRVDDAAPLLAHALAIAMRHHGPGHPTTRKSMASMADAHVLQGDYTAAERLGRDLLAGCSQGSGAEAIDPLNDSAMLARTLFLQQRWSEAGAAADEVARLEAEKWGKSHRYSAYWVNWSAIARRYAGDETGARSALSSALRIMEPKAAARLAQQPRASDTRFVLRDAGLSLLLADRAAEAEPLLREAAGTRRQSRDIVDLTRLGSMRATLGACLTRLGQYAEGEALLLDGIASMQTADYLNWKAYAVHELAALYEKLGRASTAAHWRERVTHYPPREWRAPTDAGDSSPGG